MLTYFKSRKPRYCSPCTTSEGIQGEDARISMKTRHIDKPHTHTIQLTVCSEGVCSQYQKVLTQTNKPTNTMNRKSHIR